MKEDVLEKELQEDSKEEKETYDESQEDDFTPFVLGDDGPEVSENEDEKEEEPQDEEILQSDEIESESEESKSESIVKLKERFRIKNKKAVAIVSACVLAAAVIVYAGGVIFYQNHFFAGTEINGFNCSNMTVEEAQQSLVHDINAYKYVLNERNGKTEVITGEELAMAIGSIGDLNEPKAKQNPFKWCFDVKSRKQDINIIVTIDEAILGAKVKSLECIAQTAHEMEGAANLITYKDGAFVVNEDQETKNDGYYGLRLRYTVPIFPEQKFYGIPKIQKDIVSSSKLTDCIKEGMYALKPDLNLEEAGCYVNMAEESNLKQALDTMNRYIQTKVSYLYGDEVIPLDCGSINEWVTVDDSYNVYLDEDKVYDWVSGIARKYNTIGSTRTFTSSSGGQATVSGGDYGWKVDVDDETDELCKIIKNGEETSREPVYSQKAASHGSIDVGNTYVEISIDAQHLWFYKDGAVIVSSDMVSGNPYAGNATPTGIYRLKYKERNSTLVGENYRTPVSYWMPFNGGVGMHDANWRGAFGGSIYLGGGSHGCINLPPSVAASVYAAIEPGNPVIVY